MNNGEEAFVVVVRRRDGGLPKLCKVIGEKFHCTREEADAALAALSEDIRGSFQVCKVLVSWVI